MTTSSTCPSSSTTTSWVRTGRVGTWVCRPSGSTTPHSPVTTRWPTSTSARPARVFRSAPLAGTTTARVGSAASSATTAGWPGACSKNLHQSTCWYSCRSPFGRPPAPVAPGTGQSRGTLLPDLPAVHPRRHMPTRRVALGQRLLPTAHPGYGPLLLACVAATTVAGLDEEQAEALGPLLRDARQGLAVPR